jgi:preprotein translocase subunit SecF
MTYSEAANLAVNQTLVRSINTSVVALLPVASILFVGAGLLGAGTLEDLALALFVGIAVGTYSSIFVATPVAAQLKEREPAMQALARRVAARRAAGKDQAVVAVGAADRPKATAGQSSDVTDGSTEGDADDADAQPVGAGTRSTATTAAGQAKRVQPKGKKRTGKRR